jgi:hypothetical protein
MKSVLIAMGEKHHVFSVEPNGFKIQRLADLAEVTFYGDDNCERFRDRFNGDESPESINENDDTADEVAEAFADEFPALPPLKTWSLLINWQDNDLEQGNYAWSGQACSMEAAENMARWAMWVQRQSDYIGDPWEEPPADISDEHGSVVEIQEGAIWKAADLEKALADLLKWERRMGGFDAPCWKRARDLLNEIRNTKGA